MAETLISPGVIARENDQSFVTAQPVERGAAIIGPAVIGPIERPTLISSFSSYQAIFGGALQSGSNEYSYLTSIAANQYFQNGGTSLLVTRVTSGSFTSATSTTIQNVKEDISYDEFGIELLDVTPEMKEQFDELIEFVEKKTGLSFVEYPKFNLYTLDGYRDYNAASYLDDFDKDYEEGEWERAVLSENMLA